MKFRTSCTRDCPDACGMLATVKDGRVVRLEGDPDHPVTRGFLCYRTHRFLERQYDPDRLTAPLLRKNGSLEPVGWDEALDRAAEEMLRIRQESGPASILHYRCGGSLGLMKHVTDYFFERFGPVAVKSGDICSGAGEAAQAEDFGECDASDLDDLRNARTVVLWGKNPFVSSIHLVPMLREAKGRGARLVQIDPVHHRGADECDLYLQPRPGGDGALALGAARLLFERDAVDPSAPDYCDNLDRFRDLAFSRTVDAWAEMADVPVAGIGSLADAFTDNPVTVLAGWGMQRRAMGARTVRIVDALAAVTGNVGIPGAGVSFYFRRRGSFDLTFQKGIAAAPRTVPESRLGPAILEASDPPVRLVWVTGANPVVMLPESETTRRALESRDFTVVVDPFLTDTGRCADLVLPCATMLEDDDLVGAYGHHWIGEVRPVVEPPAGVMTDYGITRELARRVGLGDEFSEEPRAWKTRMLTGLDAGLEDLENGAIRRPDAPRVIWEGRRFPTATGRVNLVHEAAPEPPELPEGYPLYLTAISVRQAQCSQWPAASQAGPETVTVHPDAAAAFAEGDVVSVESEIGSMQAILRFDPRQRRDVLLLPKGGWLRAGRCANALIRAKTTDAGGGAAYYDTPVRLLRSG